MNPYLAKCMPYIRKPFVTVQFLHCHPYSWLDSTSQPAVIRNGWARAHWYFNVAIILMHSRFVVCRTKQLFLSPAASLAQKFYMAFLVQIYLLAVLVHVTTVTTRNDFVPFLRGFIGFLQDSKTPFPKTSNFTGQYVLVTAWCKLSASTAGYGMSQKGGRKVKICYVFWVSFYYTEWLLLGSLAIFNILRPSSPEFLSSLFVENSLTTISIIPVTLASFIYQAYVAACVAQVWNLAVVPLMLFMFTTPDFLTVKPPK